MFLYQVHQNNRYVVRWDMQYEEDGLEYKRKGQAKCGEMEKESKIKGHRVREDRDLDVW